MVVRHSSSGVFDDLHPQHDVHLQHRGVHGSRVGRDRRGESRRARGSDDRHQARVQRAELLRLGLPRRQGGLPNHDALVRRDHRRAHRRAGRGGHILLGVGRPRPQRFLRRGHDPLQVRHGEDIRPHQQRQGVQHLRRQLRTRIHHRAHPLRAPRIPLRRRPERQKTRKRHEPDVRRLVPAPRPARVPFSPLERVGRCCRRVPLGVCVRVPSHPRRRRGGSRESRRGCRRQVGGDDLRGWYVRRGGSRGWVGSRGGYTRRREGRRKGRG